MEERQGTKPAINTCTRISGTCREKQARRWLNLRLPSRLLPMTPG